MEVDPEMERIWREDDEPSFSEVRATMANEEETVEEESEQPTEEVMDSVEDEAVSTEEVEEESEDEPEATEEKAVEDNSTFKIKASDMELDLTLDELKALASKGLDYTKKTQTLAPWRKTISALQESGLGETDVSLMIDVLKGDKHAIAEVLNRTKVDPLELDTDKVEYTPKSYGKDDTQLAIEDVVNEISMDKEYEVTAKVVDEVWDSESRQKMAKNPSLIRGLHEEIKMGRYEIVAPIAMKMKTMDMVRGGQVQSDLDYYQSAVDAYLQSAQQQQAAQKEQGKQKDVQDRSTARKAATTTKRMSGGKSVIDYLDDNDDDFDKWLSDVKARA
jgi:hypothetical protein